MTRILRGRFRLGLLASLAATSLLLGVIPVHASRPVATNGGTLTIGVTSDALTLDPTLTTDEASGPVEDLLFNSLVKFNTKVQIVPDLASSWTISNDGKTYTFHLRPNVTFHDGSKLTSSDVAASLARLRDRKTASPWASFFTDIASVSTPNATTIVMRLQKPYAPFLAVIASFLTVSSAKFVAAHKGNLTRVEDGTGPFMLKSWVPNTAITLVRNPHYFLPGLPHLDKVIFQVIPSDASRIAALRTGQIQFAAFLDPIYFPMLQQLQKSGRAHILHVLDINYHLLGFNTKRKPFNSPLVRLAISYAIDRNQILQAAGRGQGVITGLLTPALQSWTVPLSRYAPYKPNLAKARELLKRAGYPHGFSFNIMASHYLPSDFTAAEIIQQQLKPLGINARVVPTEWGVYVHKWDLLATLAAFAAEAVATGLRRWCPNGEVPQEVLVSGGGVHNRALMEALARALAPIPLRSIAAVGGHPDAKEALAFAVLGYLTLRGRAGNLPSVTGARHPVLLGSITPGHLGHDLLAPLGPRSRDHE